MRFDNQRDASATRRMLWLCMSLSVVLGIVVGEVSNYADQGKLHIVSFTERGPLTDGLALLLIILIVFGERCAQAHHAHHFWCGIGTRAVSGSHHPFLDVAAFDHQYTNWELILVLVNCRGSWRLLSRS